MELCTETKSLQFTASNSFKLIPRTIILNINNKINMAYNIISNQISQKKQFGCDHLMTPQYELWSMWQNFGPNIC